MTERRPGSSKCIHIVILVVFTNVISLNTATNDGVEEGRQIIHELYRNFSASSSIIEPTAIPVPNPVDLVFILDRSASVTEPGWQSMLRFVLNFLEHFTVDEDNTRIAVISYGTRATLDIDGVAAGDYNKCAFVATFQSRMARKVPSGYSSTHGALLLAVDVVLRSRANAKKAVIVITNGKSNIGPPPIRASIQLRSLVWDQGWNVTSEGPQLQVYAFGIKDANMSEVRSVAWPLPNHTFYIPTFRAFSKLASSLHDGSQSENWQVLGDSTPCRSLCHEQAYCMCGTRSGQYLCVCKDGYQGDGTTCTACPRGTYKSIVSPSRCAMCPPNSTTLAVGATDVEQCVCESPLHQEALGEPCQIRYCADLPDIDHGHKSHVSGRVLDELPDTGIPCKNLPDTSCHYQCEAGYRLSGHPGLACHTNGSWEGEVPVCQTVDCGTLDLHHQEDEHSSVTYVNQTTTYGSLVLIECHRGWRSFGDTERICTQYGTWSGTRTWCVENLCQALLLSPGLIVTPASCGQTTQVSGAECEYMCEPGYELIGLPQVYCTEHGAWDISTPTVCIDREPPSITCPDDLTTPVTTANYAVIQWKSHQPLVTDNSGEFIITRIGVADSDSPLRLTAGLHQVQYIARDKSGNEDSCIQRITVVDFTVHLVTCPEKDLLINMTSHHEEVVWPEVMFVNNNNVTIPHKCTPENNTLLPPGIYTVSCVADTQTYQHTHCQFKAVLRQPRCDMPPPPLHGGVTCSSTSSSIRSCIPYCQDNFDFHSIPQQPYICDLHGMWILPNQQFWPDCSRKYYPHKAFIQGEAKYMYYSEKCADKKDEIATKFAQLLKTQTKEICGTQPCSVKVVAVYCWFNSKRRRSIDVKLSADADDKSPQMREDAQQEDTGISSLITSPQHHKLLDLVTSVNNVQEKSSEIESNVGNRFPRGVSQVKGSHRKNAAAVKLFRSDSQNKHSKTSDILQQHVSDTVRDPEFEMPVKEENSYNSMMSGKEIIDEGGLIDWELYETDESSQRIFSYPDFTHHHFKAESRNSDGTKEGTECSDCLKEVTSGVRKDAKHLKTHLVNRSRNEPQMKISALEQNMALINRSKYMILKRTKKAVTDGYYDSSADNSYYGDSVPPLTDDLNGSAPNDYLDESQEANVIKIEFTIYNEILNESISEVEKEMINSLLDLHARLSDSLLSQNLILDDVNITDSAYDSNSSIGDSGNILFPLNCWLDKPSLEACDVGYVTLYGNDLFTQSCVACPAGSHYDVTKDACEACLLGYYQPEEAQLVCLSCPDQMMTQYLGANNRSMCSAACGRGEYSGTGLAPCLPCPLHHIQFFPSATSCLPCPGGRKTLRTGATSFQECLDMCDPGTYSETGLVPCMICPIGTYQEDHGATECLVCQDGLTTSVDGATNISQCLQWDACSTTDLVCQNGGHCEVQNNLASCACSPGFSGVSCEINIPDCYSSSCQNNGTCVDGINTFTCSCLPGFSGTKCEVNIDECISSPCLNGGSCLDLVSNFKCFCLSDFSGVQCETRISQCDGNICVHGRCEERNEMMSCVCSQGFAGLTCNTSYDLCSTHPCVHAEECHSTPGHFHCQCLPGFSGALCDVVIDPCANSNCSRVSSCIPTLNNSPGYLCKCPGGWTGLFCENETSPDFDLVFKDDAPDGQYVVLPPEFIPSLQNFSLCAWLRPQPLSAFATIVTFTLPLPPLTFQGNNYHVAGGNEFQTIFSIRHTDNLTVSMFNHSFSTNISLTSYVWSHLCFTWSSQGSLWQVMINGSLCAQGAVDHAGLSLPAHVSVVIGQSNPYYAEASTQWGVYTGEMTQFNMFSSVLSLDDVRSLASERTCNKTFGDVISWTDIILYVTGDLIFQEYSHCLDINECWFPGEFPCGNSRACVDLLGSYNCSSCIYGYTGSNCTDPDDECMMDKCESERCVDGPEPYDYRCFCPSGFTGQDCDVIIDLCLSAPCQNGGSCIPKINSFSCVCPEQHMGPFCERPASACFPNPCQNHGVCTEKSDNTYTCSCGDDFTGRLCEKRKHWCDDHVCYNGGVCQNLSLVLQDNVVSEEESFCSCKAEWKGRQCEIKTVLTCDLSPCINGGTCVPLSDSNHGYRCLCPDMGQPQLDENCEYMNPCESSPCANNKTCVLLPNYTYICVCMGGHICDQGTQNASYNNASMEKISTHNEHLTREWVWAVSVGASIVILLVIAITYCSLRKRKHKRSLMKVLNTTAESAEDHLTNPAFHSEELQMEESIYAELGDSYDLPEEESTTKDLRSQQPPEAGAKSANPQRASSRIMSISPSGSLSSLRSSLSRKALVMDDSNKPLLSSDYLEPFALGRAPASSTQHVRGISSDFPPRLEVTNARFDPGEYLMSNMSKPENGISKSGMKNEGFADHDTASEGDNGICVNEHNPNKDSAQYKHMGEDRGTVYMFMDPSDMAKVKNEPKPVTEDKRVNVKSMAPVSKQEEPKRVAYDRFHQGEGHESVQNPGYIPIGEMTTDSQFDFEDFLENEKGFQTSLNSKSTEAAQGYNSLGDVKKLDRSYVPFPDVRNTRHSDSNTSLISKSSSRRLMDVKRSSSIPAEFDNQSSDKQSLSVVPLGFTKHKLRIPSALPPLLLPNPGGKTSGPHILEHQRQGSEVYDPVVTEGICTVSQQPSSAESTSNAGHVTSAPCTTPQTTPKENPGVGLLHSERSHHQKVESGNPVPEYVELVPANKLVLTVPHLALPGHGQRPVSLPVGILETSSIMTTESGDSLTASGISSLQATGRNLPHS